MPRGGRQIGGEGAKGQRTDMALKQPIQLTSPTVYGQQQAQLESLQNAPLPTQAGLPGAAGGQGGAQSGASPASASAPPPPASPPPAALPGQLSFLGPTTRPGEAVTSGLPSGAGPGPEAIGLGATPQLLSQRLTAMSQTHPSADLASLAALAKLLGA